jgi:hypothetical protein
LQPSPAFLKQNILFLLFRTYTEHEFTVSLQTPRIAPRKATNAAPAQGVAPSAISVGKTSGFQPDMARLLEKLGEIDHGNCTVTRKDQVS